MAKNTVLEGVFAINKPVGTSSAQIIRDCQTHFNPSALFAPLLDKEKAARAKEPQSQFRRRNQSHKELRVKMGHGGTLDPLATGVLILGVGRGTKSLSDFLHCTKTYETVVLFGASTDTYDRLGRIIQKKQYDEITRSAVEKALEGFRGRYQQMPPLYSALKMEGKPLYEYAREGKPIPREIATREVEVSELELVEWYEPGTHSHRWPTEEANDTEKTLATSVWKLEERQAAEESPNKKLTPEQEEEESKALAVYESKKRQAEMRVDELVYENRGFPSKRQRLDSGKVPMMSGALGELPSSPSGKGSNLVPPPPAPGTPPPWAGKGPPAAKIRLTVTSGFYVRSFCHDLGAKLDSAAMLAELCRTRQGDYAIGGHSTIEYSDLAEGEAVWGPKVQRILSHWMSQRAEGGSATADNNVSASGPSKNSPLDAEPTQSSPVSKKSGGDAIQPDEKDKKSADPLPTPQDSNVSSVQADEEEWHGFDDSPAPAKAESQ